jgi:hypothetical protein
MSDSSRFHRDDVQQNLMAVMAAMDPEHWIEHGGLCYSDTERANWADEFLGFNQNEEPHGYADPRT